MKDLLNPPTTVPSFEQGSSSITLDQLKMVAPASIRKNITQDMADVINSTDDEDFRENFKENILTFSGVLKEGKYKFADYICACKYVSHKLLGDNNTLAYSKVFPNRYKRLLAKGMESRSIAAYTSAYNKNELVAKIMERTLVPIYVLNSDKLQRAINVQVELMEGALSETVRQKASATLIENLQQPEAVKVELDVGYSNDTIDDLRAVTRELALQQQKLIAGGHTTAASVAGSDIIQKNEDVVEAEFEEMEIDDEDKSLI